MASRSNRNRKLVVRRRGLVPFAALAVIAGLAIAGPSGVLAWTEAHQLKQHRSEQLAALRAEKEALEHRVTLLDAAGADPDLVSELIRKNLNVVHPDEVVIMMDVEPR